MESWRMSALPPPAPRLAVGCVGLHSVAGSVPRWRRSSISFMSASRTARPLQPGHLAPRLVSAVDRQDRLEASPLISAVGSAALGFPSDRTVAPPPLPIWALAAQVARQPGGAPNDQQDHPARDAAHPACGL